MRYDLSPLDWSRLEKLVREEIEQGLLDAGLPEERVTAYLQKAEP